MVINNVNSISAFFFERNFRLLSILFVLFFLISTGVFLWLGINQSAGLIVLGIIIGIPFLYLCIKIPKFWIFSIAATSAIFFKQGGDDISALEIIQGGFFCGSVFFWISWMIFIKREKIVRNFADWSILFFFLFLILTLPLSMLNGNIFINWTREYILFSIILLYFPIRHYFDDKKDLIILLVIFMLSISVSGIQQLIFYKQNAIKEAVYAYQLGSSARFNQSILSMAVIGGFLFSLFPKKLWQKLSILMFTCLSTVALIVSFSRTFWIMVFFAIVLSWFYFPKEFRWRALVNSGIILITITIGILFVFKNNSQYVFKIIERRISSAGSGTKDLSVKMRFKEYESVWSSISKYPLGGTGLGTVHEYMQPIDLVTIRTLNIHNGYLFLIFRLGYPLVFFFVFPLIFYIFKANKLALKTKDPFYKLLLLISMTSLLLMMGANFLAMVFNARDGIFVILLSLAFIGICEKKILSGNNENTEVILKEIY